MRAFDETGVMDRLRQLDGDLFALFGGARRFELVIVGGSALMVQGLLPHARATRDIDVLRTASEVEELLARYDMNTDVATFLYRYPQGWEERKVRVPFEGDALDVYTLSNEDLAITKLLSWRAVDQSDLRAMKNGGGIDFGKLRGILDDALEVRVNLEDAAWEQLLAHVVELEAW